MRIYNLLILVLLINVQINAQAAHLKFETLDGKEAKLSDYYSQGPLLINFWALWCEPCRVEMKELQSLFSDFGDQGFTVLGINQDSPRSLSKVRSYVSGQRITYPVILDPSSKVFQKFNGQVIPLSLLFNQKGEIVYRHTGYLPGDELKLRAEIEKLLLETK